MENFGCEDAAAESTVLLFYHIPRVGKYTGSRDPRVSKREQSPNIQHSNVQPQLQDFSHTFP